MVMTLLQYMSTGPLTNGGCDVNIVINKERQSMKALQETTNWATPNHTYLLDGSRLVAYIRQGTDESIYFKSPIKNFDLRRRTFRELEINPFTSSPTQARIKTIQASRPGVTYTLNLDEGSCTCPGFQFRGACKHVKELA
jgi:hypothetical protein